MLKLNWQETYSQYSEFLKSFHWADLFKLSVLKMLFPLLIGYLIISLALGLLAYLAALIILKLKRK